MISQLFRTSAQKVLQTFRPSVFLQKLNFHSRYGTFTTQDFIHDNSHGETGSLITRFVKYLAIESCKHDPLTPQTIRYSEYYPVSDVKNFSEVLRTTPTDQLSRLVVFTYTYKTNGEPAKFVQAINEIDSTCVQRLHEMDYDNIIRTLYAFMFLLPNKIAKTQFYRKSLTELVERFEKSANKEFFVQTCFYLGMGKRNPQTTQLMREFLQSHLSTYLWQLSAEDLAIVSNSAFKTSVIIANPEFQDKLVKETLKTPSKDDGLLITFVKSLRLNRIKSIEINEKLKSIVTTDEVEKYDFKGLTHFFAYFAEAQCNEKIACEAFIQKCMAKFDQVGPEGYAFNDMRQKDVATFLWCCANLATHEHLTDDDFKLIADIIASKIGRSEYRYSPDELVDTCLSLWMLGFKSEGIISELFNLNINTNTQNTQRIKLDSRFRLLMSCIEIENPELLKRKQGKEKAFVEARPAPAYVLKSKDSLMKVYEYLQKSGRDVGVEESQVVSPILELNIPGILVKSEDKRVCYVEVLERNQFLQYDEKPVALASLKFRLLGHLGYNVVMLNPADLESEETISQALSDKLNFLSKTSHKEAEEVAV